MSLWAVTSYFNPAGYRQRLSNFREFRSRLNAPLVVVELSLGDRFELSPGDAETVLGIRDGDVMWQKERLLNVALTQLPDDCTAVAWLDCDVVFERRDWAEAASRLLDEVPLVQLFRDRFDLARGILPDGLADPSPFARGQSLARRLEEGVSPAIVSDVGTVGEWRASLGLAWAARRDVIERHGLYDAGILGGGDRAFIGAALGEMTAIARPWWANRAQIEHYRTWAEPFRASVRGRLGYVEGRLFHLWHGDKVDRGYLSRYENFGMFAFDPAVDVALSREGAWRWASAKPEMHEYVREYFHARREDG